MSTSALPFSALSKSIHAILQLHRRLKLRNIPELSKLSGGKAVEVMAEKATNPLEFPLEIPATRFVRKKKKSGFIIFYNIKSLIDCVHLIV